MKLNKYILTACLAIGLLALSAAEVDGLYIWKNGNYTRVNIDDIFFYQEQITIGNASFDVNNIDSITFVQPEETSQTTDTVYVNFAGQTATVSPQNMTGITAEVNGAAVSITNANTDREMTFVLSGESTEGSFVYDGEYKTCIRLAGVNLQSKTGAAIHIKCGKRIALELADETANFLTDATEDLGQKATLYCKGHMEVSKGGSLSVRGNVKHAISTKEYMLVKGTAGSITITGAEGDGIHAGQYFKMNGGTVSISGTKGDGIQAEATSDDDYNNGQIIVGGGTIDVTLAESDAAALKSDSLMTISGGKLTITTTGDGDKGLKSKADLNISGGELTFTQSGKYIVVDNDPGYVTSIKADGDLNISGGSITINNTGEAGKGLSADSDLNISEDNASLTLDIKANGSGGALDLSRNVNSDSGSGGDDPDEPETVYRICATLSSSNSNYWKNAVYLYSSDGTKIGQMTKTIKVEASGQTTRTFYCYEFDEPTTGQFYFASDDYKNQGGGGGWPGPGGGGGQTYTIRTKTVNGPTESTPSVYYYINTTNYTTSGYVRTFSVTDFTSRYADGTIIETGSVSPSGGSFATAAGIKGDKNVSIAGGTITITNSGAAAKGISCDKVLLTTGGDITITNSGAGTGSSSSYATAKGMTSDGSIDLQGGNITIQMSGTGGKGIKSDGTLTIGKSDTEGPLLKVTTTGTQYASSSSAKAIKAVGTITVNGGETTINTSTAGAEGMESKLKAANSIVFNGGKHYFKCYDDCLNTAGCIVFDGGIVVCYSNGNDAIDSNYGAAGAITIGNGVVMGYTSKGNPEEGFDCDNNSYIKISGYGIGISGGGNQGGGWGGSSSSSSIGSAVQGYFLSTSSISYSTNRYYTLADSNGKNLVTYSVEASFSSSLSLFTATGMVKGSKYTIKYSTTKPADATTEWHGLYLGSSAEGTTQTTSFTAK
jgi:hypothetical protein